MSLIDEERLAPLRTNVHGRQAPVPRTAGLCSGDLSDSHLEKLANESQNDVSFSRLRARSKNDYKQTKDERERKSLRGSHVLL